MVKRLFKQSKLFFGITLIVASIGLFSFGSDQSFFEISKNLDILVTTLREVEANYVDEVNVTAVVQKGIHAMLENLDPYTEFIPEESVEDFKLTHVSTDYGGIGALIQAINNEMVVSEVLEGLPAQKSDLKPGDVILKVNDVEVSGKKVEEISSLLKGAKKSSIKVTIKRAGVNGVLVKNIQREEIKIPNVSYAGFIENGIGYIKLDKFLENSALEVKEAFVALKQQQALKGIILDLRENGGGIMMDAVKISNLFLPKGQLIVSQKGRKKENNAEYFASSEPVDINVPLVVLVDNGSASASEIVTGAIQETDRGVIIGQRTFGKGLVQNTVNLSYNALLKVTIAKYYTPSGRSIQALDYTHRKKDGSVDKVADSLITAFTTKGGRIVYDGSGIFPDILTKEKNYHQITAELFGKNIFFFFSNNYFSSHSTISPARDFSLSEVDFQNFKAFVKEKNFTYQTRSEQISSSLEKSIQEESKDQEALAQIKILNQKIQASKENDLEKYRNEIEEVLEGEIAARYYFQKGRIESTFNDDAEITEALKVLKNPSLYQSIIKGEGSFKTIGKPEDKSQTENTASKDSDISPEEAIDE
jgi:carboxyl-terminal processing protease